MNKLISFSLFGNEPKYDVGAVENVKLARDVYPGWMCRFYCEAGTREEVLNEIEDEGGHIVLMGPDEIRSRKKAWRFMAASDPDLDVAIFRDADSRVNVRERAAVDEWLRSGKPLHVMRDHDHHCCYEIFGGMWGILGGKVMDMIERIANWTHWTGKGKNWDPDISDTPFVCDQIWPLFYPGGVIQHQRKGCESKWGGDPFPDHPEYDGFVGEIIEVKSDVCNT